MPQYLLDDAQIGAAFQQMGGEGVAWVAKEWRSVCGCRFSTPRASPARATTAWTLWRLSRPPRAFRNTAEFTGV